MINFNQKLAAEIVSDLKENRDISHKLTSLIAQSGPKTVAEAVKNCRCYKMPYNDMSELADYLGNLLARIHVVSMDEVWGLVIPEFFCRCQEAVKKKNDGNISSEPIDQSQARDARGS